MFSFVICVISNSQCRCLTILKFYAWRIWMMISFIVQNKYFIQWISHSSVRCSFLSPAFDRLWVWNSCPLGPQVEEGWLQIHIWWGNSNAIPYRSCRCCSSQQFKESDFQSWLRFDVRVVIEVFSNCIKIMYMYSISNTFISPSFRRS